MLVSEPIDTALARRACRGGRRIRRRQGVVELGTIIGYSTAIGNALNIFEVALPAGQAPYFKE